MNMGTLIFFPFWLEIKTSFNFVFTEIIFI